MDMLLAPSILWSESLGRQTPPRTRWVTGADDKSGTKSEKDRARVKTGGDLSMLIKIGRNSLVYFTTAG